jgi:(p)ppGpp synthase/HD superfamily hydrolase
VTVRKKSQPAFSVYPHVAKAVSYACELHAGQARKGTTIPYASHLMAVAGLVMEQGGNEDETIAGVLHDAIEDQNHDGSVPGQIERRFGRRVRELVEACSDSKGPRKGPWRARKKRYLRHLGHARPGALLISAADKLHNARALLADYRQFGDKLWKRFTVGRDDQLWYYGALVAALRRADKNGRYRGLVDEFERVVDALICETARAGARG